MSQMSFPKELVHIPIHPITFCWPPPKICSTVIPQFSGCSFLRWTWHHWTQQVWDENRKRTLGPILPKCLHYSLFLQTCQGEVQESLGFITIKSIWGGGQKHGCLYSHFSNVISILSNLGASNCSLLNICWAQFPNWGMPPPFKRMVRAKQEVLIL